MAKARKPITAGELMRRLEADPDWRAERERREADLAARAALHYEAEAEMLVELRAAGYSVSSVWDFVNNRHIPEIGQVPTVGADYASAYPILVRHLHSVRHPRVREGIVRALSVKGAGLAVEAALRSAFAEELDAPARWVLANGLRVVMGRARFTSDALLTHAYQHSGELPGTT